MSDNRSPRALNTSAVLRGRVLQGRLSPLLRRVSHPGQRGGGGAAAHGLSAGGGEAAAAEAPEAAVAVHPPVGMPPLAGKCANSSLPYSAAESR
jgi:hypothetical protein